MKDLVLRKVNKIGSGVFLTERQWMRVKRWLKEAGILLTEKPRKPSRSGARGSAEAG